MKSNSVISAVSMLLLVILPAQCLYIQVNNEPFCFTLPRVHGSHYNIFYESVSSSSALECTIQSAVANLTIRAPSNHTYIQADSMISVCLRTTSRNNAMEPVSLDIYTSQQEKYKQLALKSDVQGVHQDIINVGLKLKQAMHMEKFEEQRQVLQAQIINKHERSIYLYAIVKIMAILVVILGQVFMFRKIIPNGAGTKLRQFFNI